VFDPPPTIAEFLDEKVPEPILLLTPPIIEEFIEQLVIKDEEPPIIDEFDEVAIK
jgi:hypothetical protein